jgi:hypothetical protein
MTVSSDQAVRNQQMMMLVLGMAAVKAVARNRVVIVLGLIAVAGIAHRQGAATTAALRRRAAANVAAWRHH